MIMNLVNRTTLILLIVSIFYSCNSSESTVETINDFNKAVANAQPGDEIVLKNGVWTDAEFLFEANGTAEQPITLKAEEKGKVFIEGESNLSIAGSHLVIEGLVFRNGYTPSNEVISFMKDDGVYAYNTRLTECVIDNFNHSERFETNTWVAIYGKNNRVDHCYFVDKRNQGVTLTVRLIDTLCQNNNHVIDHNYFGYRQNLGSNGGETMRIGTSHYSLSNSGTVVEANYFDRCDGEVEIVSNKSCGNIFKNNTFFECRGTLSYRHGNDNISEGNFFLGNGKDNTGGIRIINKRNKAINNYFYGLKGYRFGGALVIMNGVPNSPINRYHQVVGGEFMNNSFIDCDHIQLCAGSDAERSLAPADSKIEGNLFYHSSKDKIFTVYDDISGIAFKNNYVSSNIQPLKVDGVDKAELALKLNENNIYVLQNSDLSNVGCTLKAPVANSSNTGVSWYPIEEKEMAFGTGNKITVEPGLNTLVDAIENSKSGDVIVLKGGQEYKVKKKIQIGHPITIISDSDEKPLIRSGKSSLFTIENGGSLKLNGLAFDGQYALDKSGNTIISTSPYSMNRNYKLIVEDCHVYDLDINHSFSFIKVFKNTKADSLVIRNCVFENVTGDVVALNKETEELGIYNAEYVIYENSVFKDVQGTALNVLRGGSDESTFAPIVSVNHCVFDNVGHGKRNKIKSSLYFHGVQVLSVSNSIFTDSKPVQLYLTNGEPITTITNCSFDVSNGIISNNQPYTKKKIYQVAPEFAEGSYTLSSDSKLIGAATDGNNIGLRN